MLTIDSIPRSKNEIFNFDNLEHEIKYFILIQYYISNSS